MNIKIGTRGSKLAMTQTMYVQKRLMEAFPMHTFELVVIKTMGDMVLDRPISQIGNKGVFVREIEEKLQSGEIQLAVHSMKDMPAQPAKGLKYTKAWQREDPRDVLILREAASFDQLPPNAVIGTGSYRRQSQLLKMRGDLIFQDIRGNVDTRIKKMKEENLDGIVLAAAGLKRLGMQDVISQYLSFDEMVPAPAQGVLALEIKESETEIEKMINALFDEESEFEAVAERTFLKEIDGDCTIPVGAVCKKSDTGHDFYAFYTRPFEENLYTILLKEKDVEGPKALAKRAAFEIRKKFAGKVSLVGAGPGDEKLITVKGQEAIRQADCILYDRLSSTKLLSFAKKDCELVYVGKANHDHTYPQAEINQMLIQKAMMYRHVVRLKGGDVYVFGRGSEEAVALKEAGISFEIVPGVSSAIAGLSYAGIPITSRGISRGFTVVTAKNKQDELADIDFHAMLKKDHTYVFLMGLSSIKEITSRFIMAGKEKDTPAAVVSNATNKNQRTVVSTLENLYDAVLNANLKSPALIVVGDVVTLREELNFFEEKVLFQRTCVVPYVGEANNAFIEKLDSLGAAVEEIQVGEIKHLPNELDQLALKKVGWIVFTSKNGVHAFFLQLQKQKLDLRILAGIRFAVIGQKTKECLNQYGIYENFVPMQSDSVNFATEFAGVLQKTDLVWIVKAKNEDHSLQEKLALISECKEIYSYENCEVELQEDIDLKTIDAIFFTCASSAKRICDSLKEDTKAIWNREKVVYSIGPKTTEELKKHGITGIQQANQSSYESLLAKMLDNLYN